MSCLLEGKKGLVFGVANDRSIAWHIARQAMQHGAVCGFACLPGEKNERRARKAIEEGGVTNPWLVPCDVSNDESVHKAAEAVRYHFQNIDFLVHSVAYADREFLKIGSFINTPRQVFSQALDISAYSLLALAQKFYPIMNPGASIICMSYYGGDKVIPGYNVMGVAKSALECVTRYLAYDLGDKAIRVNAISAGAIKTLSSMAVGGIDTMFEHTERKAPLKRNITAEEVGKTAVYLLSDLSSGVTGETLFVDSGFNIVGL
ncbi:MAG: Enoyl-[acyl-carrier-protein] reductase [NADH] FabI [Phycisphaerae bacterium]|nr:Enoyl-[acyl-carrier-protein] reductase [NADH] FabI [Phycisphaerae bacterium]